jgi:hypothetical protein
VRSEEMMIMDNNNKEKDKNKIGIIHEYTSPFER